VSDALHRYQTDPRFHAVVTLLEAVIADQEGAMTIHEMREAFTVALQRHELLRVRPALAVPPARDSTKGIGDV